MQNIMFFFTYPISFNLQLFLVTNNFFKFYVCQKIKVYNFMHVQVIHSTNILETSTLRIM